LAPNISNKTEMLDNKEAQRFAKRMKLKPEQVYKGFRLLTTGRSLLMASQVLIELKNSKKDVESASVVVGAGHMTEMKKFLSNPRLALRTTRRIIRALQEVDGTGEIVWALRRAEWAFGEQLKAQAKSI